VLLGCITQHTYNQFQRPLADRRNYVGHTSANKKLMTHLSVAAVASQWLSAKAFTPARTPAGGAANDRWVSNFDQFFAGLSISLYQRPHRMSVVPPV
jgi:hypothetical protein